MLPLAAESTSAPIVSDPAGVFAVLLASLGLVFWATQHPQIGKMFKVVPALVFCYFIPTTLTTLGVIPESSPLYSWIKTYVLPASLLLMILALDLPGIMRLGPKAVIMLLAGTAGVVVGGPIALAIGNFIFGEQLPPDTWRGMAALSGSWIGGGANYVAIGQAANTSSSMLGAMVIPDVAVASVWMGVLLLAANFQDRIDAATGANASAIRDLEARLTKFQESVTRVPKLPDVILILMLGFGASWLSYTIGKSIHGSIEARVTKPVLRVTHTQAESGRATLAFKTDKGHDDAWIFDLSFESTQSDQKDSTELAVGASRRFVLVPEKAGFKTIQDVIDVIHAEAPEWHVELLEPSVGTLPWNALLEVSRAKVSESGYELRAPINRNGLLWSTHQSLSGSTWKFILVTALGVLLSFTPVRRLEGAGASRLGTVMLYLLIACIGASADFHKIIETPQLLAIGGIWIFFHIAALLITAWLIRAPIFFVAVGSQANIGGAASAPAVAAAYHPSLAPVGALMAVAGYVLGTYAGLVCMKLLMLVAGAQSV